MDIETIKAKLTELGIKYDGRSTAEKLFDLLPEEVKETFITPPEPVQGITPKEETQETTKEVAGIDFSKLTQADLRSLKAQLDSTPLTAQALGQRTCTVRKFNGKYVVDWKKGSSRMVTSFNQAEQKVVAQHSIDIRYNGEIDFVTVDYTQLMLSERVKCKTVNERLIHGVIEEGTVFSQERKVEIPQIVSTVKRFYSVELPEGDVIEISDDSYNF